MAPSTKYLSHKRESGPLVPIKQQQQTNNHNKKIPTKQQPPPNKNQHNGVHQKPHCQEAETGGSTELPG